MICHLTFLDVGNADCTLIRVENGPVLLIDLPQPGLARDRLNSLGISSLSRIYITHDHGDHFPGISKFVHFMNDWLGQGRAAPAFCPPRGLLTTAWKRLKQLEEKVKAKTASESDKNDHKRLQAALDRLKGWEQSAELESFTVEAGQPPWIKDGLRVCAIHPSLVDLECQDPDAPLTRNEASVVLRIEYGELAAVLMADVEGKGVAAMLKRATNVPRTFECHIVKMPHHGAWPHNGNELVALLEKMNPELAVLSVGSRNPYQHVRTELFAALSALRSDSAIRLHSFICTEATRTCMKSPAECTSMGTQGLTNQQPCAGDIEITLPSSGSWEWSGQMAHRTQLLSIPHAACRAATPQQLAVSHTV